MNAVQRSPTWGVLSAFCKLDSAPEADGSSPEPPCIPEQTFRSDISYMATFIDHPCMLPAAEPFAPDERGRDQPDLPAGPSKGYTTRQAVCTLQPTLNAASVMWRQSRGHQSWSIHDFCQSNQFQSMISVDCGSTSGSRRRPRVRPHLGAGPARRLCSRLPAGRRLANLDAAQPRLPIVHPLSRWPADTLPGHPRHRARPGIRHTRTRPKLSV